MPLKGKAETKSPDSQTEHMDTAESDPVTLKLVAQIPKTRLKSDSWTSTDKLVGKELLVEL